MLLLIPVIFIYSMTLTSFLTLVGMRLPQKKGILGRSQCDSCNVIIPWYALIPVFGWFLTKGRCAQCGTPVSIKYPIYEAIGGLLYVLGYVVLQDNLLEFAAYAVFISMMITVSVSDIQSMIVPDKILLVFFPLVFALRMITPLTTWYDAIIGGVAAFAFMLLLAYYGKRRFKQDALGGGDIKLYGVIGVFLGWQLVFLSLFFASLLGIIIGKLVLSKMNPLPFVPFIFGGVLLAYFFGADLLAWYGSLFS